MSHVGAGKGNTITVYDFFLNKHMKRTGLLINLKNMGNFVVLE